MKTSRNNIIEDSPEIQTYKTIFDDFPESIVLMSRLGKIIYANKAAIDWTNNKPETLVGRNFIQVPYVSKESKFKTISNFRNIILNKKVAPYDVDFIVKNGQKRIGQIQTFNINRFQSKDKYVIAIISDITEKRKLEAEQEKKLAEAEQNQKKYIKNRLSSISNILLKIAMGDFSGGIEIPKEEDEFTEYFVALNIMVNDFADLLKENQEKTQELEKIKENLEDIVEVRTATLEKQTQDLKKFQLAVDGASDHIIITDPEGIIVYTNEVVDKITGFSKEELFGQKAGSKKNWGGQENKDFYEHFWKRIKKEKMTYIGEFHNIKKNGQKFITEAKISPIVNDKGQVLFFVGIERDITRNKEIDRMKTEFISLASHQLRTPLSAMKWFLEMLLEGDTGKLNKEQTEFLNNINDSNERMIQLVNSLLNISRIESGRIIIDPRPTNLNDLVNDVLKEVKNKFDDRKQNVIFSAHSKIPKINIDPKLIRHVYINLLTNASKYTPEKGEISIFISKNGKEIISQISDTGCGIPEEEQFKVFEKFFRAQNVIQKETDGSGLGLYLVKAIIESSGGKIWFKSTKGKGTTFWFSLPLSGSKFKEGEVRIDS